MKLYLLIVSLIVFASCKQNKNTIKDATTKSELPFNTEQKKDLVFLTLERTPCLGDCPSYKITIMHSGKVLFNGKAFIDRIGAHTKTLSQEQLSTIKDQIANIQLFELEDSYNSSITDVPAVVLYVAYNGRKKKIYNRYGGPKVLKEFEKLIDGLILDDQLKKVQE